MGVRTIKHEALMQEWTARIAECRSSGMTVKAWCEAQGISIKTYYNWEKQVVAKANPPVTNPVPPQCGTLIRGNPEGLPSGNSVVIGTDISIRHGESVITLPTGSSAETIADLVKALNRHV